jgi:signal transduction histidine kinase
MDIIFNSKSDMVTQCFKWLLLLILSQFIVVVSFARNQKLIDSLTIQLELKHDTAKYTASIGFADELYYAGNISESVHFYQLASDYETRKIQPDGSRLALVYGYMGNCLYDLAQYAKSIEWFQKALPFAEKFSDTLAVADLHANIGSSYFYMGKHQESINSYQKALSLDREMKDSLNMAVCMNNLGKVFHAWKHYDRAIDFYSQALEIGKQKNDSNGVSIRLSSIAASYMELKKFDQSINYYLQAYGIDSLMNNTARMAGRLDQLGMVYQKMGDYQTAEPYFQKALKLLEMVEKPRSQAIVLGNLGQNCLHSGNLPEAKVLFEQSLALSKELNLSQSILNNYQSLSALYDQTGNYRLSKQYLEAYMALKDSIFNVQSQKTIEEFQVMYDTEKKDFEITRLNQEKEIQTIQIKKARQQRLFFVALAIAMLLVAVSLYFLFQNRKKTSRILDAKNKELNILNSTKDRFISILAHDLKNPFSAFANITTAVNDNFDDLDKTEHKYYIEELNQSALRMNTMLKNMLEWATIQMKPVYATLEPINLNETAQQMVESLRGFAQTRSVGLHNEIPETLQAMGNQGAINTVLNNLITNAIKFSAPGGEVKLGGAIREKAVEITVTDQGVGMTDEDISKLFRIDKDTRSIGKAEGKGTGLGLILCKELMDKMGGEIGVESKIGIGTTFTIRLKNQQPNQ